MLPALMARFVCLRCLLLHLAPVTSSLWHVHVLDMPFCCVTQILEIKTESQDLVAALSALSAIYDDNTPAARRQLRAKIEECGLSIKDQYLIAADGVTQV